MWNAVETRTRRRDWMSERIDALVEFKFNSATGTATSKPSTSLPAKTPAQKSRPELGYSQTSDTAIWDMRCKYECRKTLQSASWACCPMPTPPLPTLLLSGFLSRDFCVGIFTTDRAHRFKSNSTTAIVAVTPEKTSAHKQKIWKRTRTKHFDFISFTIHTRSRKNRKTVESLNFVTE